MSKKANHQKSRENSTKGKIPREGKIIIATDRDRVGEKISQELYRIAPKTAQISRHVPKCQKDWNEALQAQIERERQQENQRSRGRGLSL